ncbi:hypothetical protein AVEN_67657-1 [Araneus ventricosus]|uniref:Secreted protein n=1 Tax=Araneus ventricosus TaxID=182803 RepID=A0A4Y2QVB7_ARAVE|nr:hypothetical protein AVEN_67657-1 [Araneus ventricosus]
MIILWLFLALIKTLVIHCPSGYACSRMYELFPICPNDRVDTRYRIFKLQYRCSPLASKIPLARVHGASAVKMKEPWNIHTIYKRDAWQDIRDTYLKKTAAPLKNFCRMANQVKV